MINEGVKQQLGGLHSVDLLIHSVDFAPIGALQADSPIPVFDTTAIHAAAAVEFLLGNTKFEGSASILPA
ncbi:aspartate/glutamate racemase [Psychrobacter sp. PL15]|uniref:hypothetical protein n=1 Tax=Psychrobacter sp. PL15 TaxID=3071719 RepID=UPI002DF92609|nr:aspartate/glutamate racemase [Psychrobacter sp. PL15]